MQMVLPDGPTEQVSGLQLVLGGVEEEVLGAVSSGGWYTLQLQVRVCDGMRRRRVVVAAVAGLLLEREMVWHGAGHRALGWGQPGSCNPFHLCTHV